MGQTIDVARFIDEQPLNRFHFRFILLCSLVLFIDGFDGVAVGFMAPAIIKEFGVANPADITPIFSYFLVGVLCGSIILGFVGDRYGRKLAIVGATMWFGVFTFASVYSPTLTEFAYLRFIAGLGFGGLLPNLFSLIAEFAPKRHRIMMIVIVIVGFNIGGVLPGPAAAFLIPTYGWSVLFVIGAPLSILAGLIVWIWLPESIKYLVVHNKQKQIAQILTAVQPSFRAAPNTVFVLGDKAETKYQGMSPAHLFTGDFLLITPLIWLLFIMCFLTNTFLISWLPVLLTMAKISASKAALFTALFQFGGLLGGVVIATQVNRWGPKPMIPLFVIGILAIAAIGYAERVPELSLMAAIFVSGACVLGSQQLLNAVTATVYPTAYRSTGAGWSLGVGRIGSILGPIVGGALLAEHMSLENLYRWATVPYFITVAASLALIPLYNRRVGHSEGSLAADPSADFKPRA
jgi:AAHS family 4-hydroxybenzoate transporter-like MFS transporter